MEACQSQSSHNRARRRISALSTCRRVAVNGSHVQAVSHGEHGSVFVTLNVEKRWCLWAELSLYVLAASVFNITLDLVVPRACDLLLTQTRLYAGRAGCCIWTFSDQFHFFFETGWLPLALQPGATVHTNLKDVKLPINLADGPSQEASRSIELPEDNVTWLCACCVILDRLVVNPQLETCDLLVTKTSLLKPGFLLHFCAFNHRFKSTQPCLCSKSSRVLHSWNQIISHGNAVSSFKIPL